MGILRSYSASDGQLTRVKLRWSYVKPGLGRCCVSEGVKTIGGMRAELVIYDTARCNGVTKYFIRWSRHKTVYATVNMIYVAKKLFSSGIKTVNVMGTGTQ